MENAELLNSRFNKGLVTSQIKSLFDYDTDTAHFNDVNKIYHAWSLSHADPMKRPRFYNVQTVLKLSQPLYVLVSAFSTMEHESREYDVIHMKTGSWVRFGIPVNRKMIGMLGGQELISRLILSSGITGLTHLIEQLINTVDSIEDRDNLKANVKLLKEIQSGIILEGMNHVTKD